MERKWSLRGARGTESCGFLHTNNSQHVLLIMNVATDTDGGLDVGESMTIPRAMVRKITPLAPRLATE